MSEMQNWDLGQSVKFDAQLYRDKTHYTNQRRSKATWRTRHCNPTKGYYMGHRIVYNGYRYPGHYDMPAHFRKEESVPHALIVVNKRRKPVRVPYDSLEVVE